MPHVSGIELQVLALHLVEHPLPNLHGSGLEDFVTIREMNVKGRLF
jgi:hypothetical protein